MERNRRLPGIPWPSLRRLPRYYRRLVEALDAGEKYLSSAELGRSAGVPAVQVRKDLSYLDWKYEGRPGVGYPVRELAAYLEEFLGLVNDKEAVLVGVGNLGRALALYPGFVRYGLRIVALFDADPTKVGMRVGEHEVLPMEKLPGLVRRLHIQMGIIAVPAEAAQEVADMLVASGITAIWNFAPCRLRVPDGVLVKDEDLAAELATLSHFIARQRVACRGEGRGQEEDRSSVKVGQSVGKEDVR